MPSQPEGIKRKREKAGPGEGGEAMQVDGASGPSSAVGGHQDCSSSSAAVAAALDFLSAFKSMPLDQLE